MDIASDFNDLLLLIPFFSIFKFIFLFLLVYFHFIPYFNLFGIGLSSFILNLILLKCNYKIDHKFKNSTKQTYT